MFKTTRKLLVYFMVVLILLPTVPLKAVKAEEGSGGAGTANEMSRSMIDFFKEDRTGLQVERVSKDEIMVYGVFISNFFIPWETKLGDIVNESAENSIPKRVSEKFFGSPDKSGQIAEVNKKLYEAITNVMVSDKRNFSMYKDTKHNDLTPTITGQQLFEKIAGKDNDPRVYGSNNQVVMDLSDDATQAALQIITGFNPDYMLDSKRGLRNLTGLYIDGVGNIWGSYANAQIEDYVLFMPSALNPVVFPKTSDGKFKFPVSNVFSMGAALKFKKNAATNNFLHGKGYDVPYYNMKKFLPDNEYNKGNIVNIFGVQSPFEHIGNSDSIVEKGVKDPPNQKVRDFLDFNSGDTMDRDKTRIVVAVDAEKMAKIGDYIKKDKTIKTEQQRKNVVDYLLKSSAFSLEQVSDSMYYFNVPRAQTYNASDSTQGDFSQIDTYLKHQTLFAEQVDVGNDTRYKFYGHSYASSPMNDLLKTYIASGEAERDALLQSVLSGTKYKTDSAEYVALKQFLSLEDKYWGTKDEKTIMNAMKLLHSKDKFLTYGILPPTDTYGAVVSDTSFEFFNGRKEPTTYAMTGKDMNVSIMSVAAERDGLFQRWFTEYDPLTHYPFKAKTNGGVLAPKDSTLTDTDTRAIATLYHNFMTYRVFSMNSVFSGQLTGVKAGEGKFTTPWEKNLPNRTAIMNDVNNYPGMYWGYMVDLLGITVNEEGTGFNDPRGFENAHLPYMEISVLNVSLDLNEVFGVAGVSESEAKTLKEMQEDIVKKMYSLLQDGPSEYRDGLIKSTIDSWIISTHRSITGSWVGNTLSVSAGGNNSYASIVGYINTPSLNDLPLTEWILKDYMYVYMLFLIIVLIVVVLLVITNTRTVREGLLIILVMSFVLIIPQFLVGNVINLSNKAGDQIYSGRFNYWAITQHQQTLKTANGYRVTGDEMDYIIFKAMQDNRNVYSSDVGVRVKWMSPKKDDYFESIFNSNTSSQGLLQNLTIFRWLFSSYMNQEEYVHNDPLATYLYRPYNAIAEEAKNSYDSLSRMDFNKDEAIKYITSKQVLGMPDYRYNLYKNPKGKVQYLPDQIEVIAQAGPYRVGQTKEQSEQNRYWMLYNKQVTDAIFRSDFTTDAGLQSDLNDATYQAFTLTTESPFYYFYNVLANRYGGAEGDFKSALLTKSVFKVNSTEPKVNDSIRDFLDMEGLFTYVIPYMHQGNEYVYGWTNIYGKSIDGYDFQSENSLTHRKDAETSFEEEVQKQMLERFESEKNKKENLKKVWKLYTPWVDQLYSLNVYSRKVPLAGRNVVVEDTLNPASYQEVGRPMIFSEADMYAKRYSEADLSDIERRIQATLETTYKDLMYLTNYYDFDDEVLLTAAAMTATFNFNREFSETKLLGESSNQYPQNFELKNFNYDAFMRLTLLNATGEPLMDDKDLYVRVLTKTSIFTGLLLLANDLTAVIVIPTMKVVVLLLLLFLSILVSISCVITPPERIMKTVIKVLGVPSLLFLVSSVGFAFLVSLFMGEGLTGYVGGRTPSFSTSDPTVMLGLLLVVDCVYLFILWKVVQQLLKGFKSHGMSTAFGAFALLAGAGASVVSHVTDQIKGTNNQMRQRRNHKELVNAMNSVGKQNSGASSGASFAGVGGFTPNTQRTNNQDTTNTEYQTRLDEMASTRHEPTDSMNKPIHRKRIGHRVVDFKNFVQNTPRRVGEGLQDVGHEVSDATRYTFSRDGLYSDAKDTAKTTWNHTKRTYTTAKNHVVEYKDDMVEYNKTLSEQEEARRQQRAEVIKQRAKLRGLATNPQ